MDFTLDVYRSLLKTLLDSGYLFMPVSEYCSGQQQEQNRRQIILRHDVDRKPEQSLLIAGIEHTLDVRGTYYFRATPGSFDPVIINEIASLGHEIGYHYEDLDLVSQKSKASILRQGFGGQENRKSPSFTKTSEGNRVENQKSGDDGEKDMVVLAYASFMKNLSALREISSIKTICMHGSPLSRYDSRLLWKYFDYGELGIETEPYFDLSLDDMLYLTDTGRRWNGSTVSIRDRGYVRDGAYYVHWVRKPVAGSAMAMTVQGDQFQKQFRFRKSTNILTSAKAGILPEKLFLTFHPQRWSGSFPAWMFELGAQNFKNMIKYLINRLHFGSGN